jgi:hypothetical protein
MLCRVDGEQPLSGLQKRDSIPSVLELVDKVIEQLPIVGTLRLIVSHADTLQDKVRVRPDLRKH